ncbi:MAG: hypothetical protein ACREJC_22185, partial [Tepidisphaeraceae bacterium]
TYTVWGGLAAVADRTDGTLSPLPFHLASVILHALSAVMVFLILRRLVNCDWPACAGAMVFAVHPLQVEAVSWASGMKDVLAGLLALAALHQHLLDWDATRRKAHVAISAVFFAAAMLAKPSAVSIIAVALVLDLLVARAPLARVALALLPWAIIAAPLVVIAALAQETQGLPSVPFQYRPLIATDSLAFYLLKLFVPINLALDYGRAPSVAIESHAALVTWLVPAGVAALIAVSRSRVVAAAGLVFAAGMIPNLGLVPFQFQFYSTVADHYAYLSMLGAALVTAWVLSRQTGALPAVVCGVVLSLLVALTIRQAGVWRDSVTLLRHAVAVNPDSAGARNNLGRALGEAGSLDQAEEQFRAAMRLAPYDPLSRRNLALVNVKRGNVRAAADLLAEAIRLNELAGENVDADKLELARLIRLASTRPSAK